MFFDTSRFALTAVLERNWQRIYQEFLSIRSALTDWRGKRLYDEGWKTFLLYDLGTAAPFEDNIARCPFTVELLHKHVSKHGVVIFSVLQPQTRVKPHQDYPSPFVRCHLPLEVPEGDCAIKVGDEIRQWVPGQVVMFDHTVQHETWNLTSKERVLLVIDFVPGPGEQVPGHQTDVPSTVSV